MSAPIPRQDEAVDLRNIDGKKLQPALENKSLALDGLGTGNGEAAETLGVGIGTAREAGHVPLQVRSVDWC